MDAVERGALARGPCRVALAELLNQPIPNGDNCALYGVRLARHYHGRRRLRALQPCDCHAAPLDQRGICLFHMWIPCRGAVK